MHTIINNPYIGPRTFSKEERHLFFGRDREARDLSALVLSENLVLFYAQSGAGKSSLINTRLIPELEQNLYEVFPVARVSGEAPDGFTPDNIYIYNLMRSLIRRDIDLKSLANVTLAEFLGKLNEDEDGYFYDESLTEPIRTSVDITPWRHALIIDQFEEVFSTNVEAWNKREDFFNQLAQALSADPYLWVILIMREDYIAALDPYAHYLSGGLRVRYYMQRLGREAALVAVKSPVNELRPYAPGIAEKLVDDLCSIKIQKPDGTPAMEPGQYVEPVQLQVVCYGLWENLSPQGKQITEKDLQDVGDVNQSLGKYYDGRVHAVAKAKHIKERLIREWFEKKLITTGGIRNMVLQETKKKNGELDDEVIQALQSDLVRAEKRGGATWYELTHDRLVEPILESNKNWFTEHLSPLQRQAALWKDQNENESWLLSDQALVEVEQWAMEHPDELSDAEQEFLETCQRQQKERELEAQRNSEDQEREVQQQKLKMANRLAEEQTRSAKRARFFNVVSGVLVVVAVIAVVLAYSAYNTANKEKINAQSLAEFAENAKQDALKEKAKADELAAYSIANELSRKSLDLSVNFDQSILLSVAAYDKSPKNPQAQNTLVQNFQRIQRLELLFSPPEDSAKNLEFSPDGNFLAVWGDSEITIRSTTTGKFASYPIADATVQVYFSPDSKMIAVVDRAGIHSWSLDENVSNAMPVDAINFHDGSISQLFVSNNGNAFVSQGEDDSIIYWDLVNDKKTDIPVKTGTDIIFSPSGEALASIDEKDNITLQSVKDNGKDLGTFQGKTPVFSPDGSLIATVNIDQTLTIRGVGNEIAPLDILPQLGSVTWMVFSNKENQLAVTDGTQTQIWDIKDNKLNDRPINDTPINGTPSFFSPDGKLLIINSYDSTRGYWVDSIYCVSSKQMMKMPLEETFQGFSPDGKTLAFLTTDGYSFRTVTDNCELAPDGSSAFEANSILFSPKTGVLASVESDGSILIRNTTDGAPIGDPIYQPPTETIDATDISDSETTGSVEGLQFSPKGSLLLYRINNKLHLWDLNKSKEIPLPKEIISDSINALSFATDELLILGYKNGHITKWNISSGKHPDLESNARGKIENIIFDPESSAALSISQNSVILLDLNLGQKISGPMDGAYLDVNWGSHLLATLKEDGIAIWDLKTGKPLKDDSVEGVTAHFLLDGSSFLVSNESEIALYSVETFELIGEPIEDKVPLNDILWSPNGKVFALAAQGNAVQIYSLIPDDNKAPIEFLGYSAYSYGGLMAFSPDSDSFYFNESNGNWIDILDLTKDYEQGWSTDRSVSGNIPMRVDEKTLIFGLSDDNDYTSSALASVWLWDIEKYYPGGAPTLIESINVDLNSQVKMLNFDISQDGKTLVTLSKDGDVYYWNIDSEFEPEGVGGTFGDKDDPVASATISQDGKKQATFTGAGIAISDPTDALKTSLPFFNEHILQIEQVSFNSDDSILAVMGDRDQTIFYDINKLGKIGDPVDGLLEPENIGGKIWRTISSGDGDVTVWDSVTGKQISGNRVVSVWDSVTGKQIKEIAKDETSAFSPDGSYFAVQDAQGKVRLFDATGTQINFATSTEEPTDSIPGVFMSFSSLEGVVYFVIQPNKDDPTLTTLWKVNADGQAGELVDLPGGFAAFTPNGRYIGLSGSDDKIILWDVANVKIVAGLKGGFSAFSPDSELLAYQSGDRVVLWNIVKRQTVGQANGNIYNAPARFSSDSTILTIPDYNLGQSILLNTKTGHKTRIPDPSVSIVITGNEDLPYVYLTDYNVYGYSLFSLKKGRINEVAIPGQNIFASPNGKVLVSTTTDDYGHTTSKLWDRLTGEAFAEEINLSEVVGFSPDGSVLINRNPDGSVTLLDALNLGKTISVINADRVVFTDDYHFAAAINPAENSIAIWDINRHKKMGADITNMDAGSIISVALSSKEKIFALFGNAGVVLWDVDKKVQKGAAALQEKSGTVTKMLFSPDNQYLASLGTDGIIVSDISQTTPTSKISIPGKILDMGFSGAKSITYLSEDFDIFEVNINSGSGMDTPLVSPIRNPKSICRYALSNDGKKLAYLISNKISIWDRMDTTTRIPEPISEDITSMCASPLAFSPDGNTLAIGDGHQIYLWDVKNNKHKNRLNGQNVFSGDLRITFIDDQTIAVEDIQYNNETGTQTSRISLWDLTTSSKNDFTFDGNLNGLISNGSILLYRDNEARVILQEQSSEDLRRFEEMRDLMCKTVGRNFTQTEWAEYFNKDYPYPIKQADATCPQWPLDTEVTATP